MNDSNFQPIPSEHVENAIVKVDPEHTSVKPQDDVENPAKSDKSLENSTLNPGLKPVFNQLFTDAVDNAQYMVAHATTKTGVKIGPKTIATLVAAKHLVNEGQSVDAAMEASFWISYQDVCDLVKPATAESIKANLSLEKTLASQFIEKIPFLSWWPKKKMVSKASRTVNRFIFVTVLVLFLLLIFQIYWVIGNKLIDELGKVSQSQDLINTQLYENEQQLKAINLRYKQLESSPDFERDVLENQSIKHDLGMQYESLQSKQDRYSAILRFWSRPWSGFIRVVNSNINHSEKFASQFADLDAKIGEIQNQISNDPDGWKAATVRAQQMDLGEQLKNSSGEEKERITAQIEKVSEKTALESKLTNLETKKEDIQAQIDNLNAERDTSQQKIIELNANKEAVQEAMRSLIEARDYYQQPISNLETIKQVIDPILSERDANTTTTLTLLTEQEMNSLPDDIKNDPKFEQATIEDQLKYLQQYRQDIEQQLSYLKTTQQDLQAQIDSDDSNQQDIQKQINELDSVINNATNKITDLDSQKKTTEDDIKNLTTSINKLELDIAKFSVVVSPDVAEQIIKDRDIALKKLIDEKESLVREEQEYLDQTDSRPAQLAGQFVLDILQSYLLPVLYGLLGATTSVLRSLSKEIKDVTYSEETGIQYLLRISLGALAGIMVGWFSFLISPESFLGSVSPLAIAFLVGYNIEFFFSRMDRALNRAREEQKKAVQQDSASLAAEEKPAVETPASGATV